MATREGGSEWEPIKILSEENSAYIPKSPPGVLHKCCQDHVAINVLLTLGITHQPKCSKHAAEQPTRVHKLAPVRPVTSTGQTGQGPDHPSNTLRVTRELTQANRVTRTSNTGSPAQLL